MRKRAELLLVTAIVLVIAAVWIWPPAVDFPPPWQIGKPLQSVR